MGRRRFSREFKLEAVRLVTQEGHSASQVAGDLGIRPEMLLRWRKQIQEDGAGAFPGIGRLRPQEEEVRGLRRDLNKSELKVHRAGRIWDDVVEQTSKRLVLGCIVCDLPKDSTL